MRCQNPEVSIFHAPLVIASFFPAFHPHHTTHASGVALERRQQSLSSSADDIDPDTRYFDWLGRQAELKLRPKPYEGSRARVDRDLAVLLMRSSYTVTDELDFVAMNIFQKDFFKQRQKEWPAYLATYPPLGIRQGDLQDPAYLDFISFSQYATINSEIRDGKQVFEELINAEGDKQVVRRDALLADNALLCAEHSRRVGQRVLERFQSAPAAYAPNIGDSMTFPELQEQIRRIMDLFSVNQFCQRYTLRSAEDQKGFKIVSRSPANLWSLQMLKFYKQPLVNDYEAKTVMALLRAGGLSAKYSMGFQGPDVSYQFRLGV